MARVRILLLALGVLLITAAPALAAPTVSAPSLTSPSPVTQGVEETFESTYAPDSLTNAPITDVEWTFSDGTAAVPVTAVPAGGTSEIGHAFAASGSQTITITVTDALGMVASASAPFDVNAPPVASFTTDPTSPIVGQQVLFESTSDDPDGDESQFQNFQWDFDNNGTYEAEGENPRVPFTFDSVGTKFVRLRVQDERGSFDEVVQSVTVVAAPPGNALPVASFSVSDSNPVVGQQVSFESSSSDSDGSIVSQRWDLDGDGDFDENVQGRNAFTSYTSPGPKIVRLEVRDNNGAVQTETRNINVRALPVRTSRRLSLMTPFPVVRIVGSFLPNGARVKLLEVSGPRGMRVNVRCAGRDCPVKQVNKRKPRRKPVRVRAFNRFMRKGTVLVVRVRKGELIGKYSRILIRGGKAPKARHLCLLPGNRKGTRCPRGRRRG